MATGLPLLATTAAVGLAHTLLGPDHYLPFILLARAEKWPSPRTAAVTLLCGLGHVGGSILLALLAVYFGFQVLHLSALERIRGDLAAWLLMAFGLAYLVWGLRRAWSRRPHAHLHAHADGLVHDHAHSHVQAGLRPAPGKRLSPWVLFIVFVFGPCEPLIPLLMAPAASRDWAGLARVAAVFSAVTLAAMLAVVLPAARGARRLSFGRAEKYAHAFSGAAILACGIGMAFLGL